MRTFAAKTTWVIYRNNHRTLPANATCTQREWERLEQEEPGVHTLIRAGIEHEGEAERLARCNAGDLVPRAVASKLPRMVIGLSTDEAVESMDQENNGPGANDDTEAVEAAA